MQSRGPEPVGENDDACGFRTIVLRADETAEDGMKTHHVEIRATDDAGLHLARLTKADHREADGREIPELTYAAGAGLDILQFRYGEISVRRANPWRALADVNTSAKARQGLARR